MHEPVTWDTCKFQRDPLLLVVTRGATTNYVTPYQPAVRNLNIVHEMAKQYCLPHTCSMLCRKTDELKVAPADNKLR